MASSKKLYDKRKKYKQCVQCGEPNDRHPRVHCTKCNNKVNERREIRRQDGTCYECSEPVYKAGRCEDHYIESLDRNNERRRERVARGVCAICEEPLDSRSRWFCTEHYIASQFRSGQWKKRMKAERRCIWCGFELEDGDGVYCATHAKQVNTRR